MVFIDKLCDFLIRISPEIIHILMVVYLAFVVFIGILLTTPDYPKFGSLFGEAAVILYVLSLVPGIVHRFGFDYPIFNVIRVYRRHIGISMYLFAFAHMVINRFPDLVIDFSSLPTYELMGMIALLIFLLLFITSNNLSQKILGVGWIYLQKLTYLGMFFVLLHLSINYISKWGIVMWIVVVVQLSSFYVAARRNQKPVSSTQ